MSDIYIIGDSLAQTRPDGLDDKKRWTNILKKKLDGSFNVVNYSRGSTTTKRLIKIYKKKVPKHVTLIIQVGIVDCAPRYFTRHESFILARFPLSMRNKVIAYFKKSRIQSEERAYVTPDKFKENLRYINEHHVGAVLYVKILPMGNKLEKANPAIGQRIEHYNRIIDIFPKFKTIAPDPDKDVVDKYTLEDGYHLNIEGHKYIAERVESLLRGCEKA